MSLNNILVTGAGGFLGSHIVIELIQKNYVVHNFSRKKYSALEKLGVIQHIGDLANYDELYLALEGIDAVIHTASLVGMWGKYQDFYLTNVIGTENLVKAMHARGIKKLVHTSTPSVVFGKDDLCGVDETTPYPKKYLTHYAKTKSIAEKFVLRQNADKDPNGLCAVVLRPHLIFGPGDLNLVPRVIEAKKKGQLKIIGDGKNLVDVIYVKNAANAHVMALEKLEFGHAIVGQAYFLGQGPVKLWDFTNRILVKASLPIAEKNISLPMAYTIGFFIECILKLFRIYKIHPPMTRFIALQLGKSHYFSHEKIQKDLGFYPKISIDEGINLTIIDQ
jgi:2-alkyl-3-oxoalkanoate reductase